MSELVTKSVAQEEQEQKTQIRTAAKPVAGLIIGVSVVAVPAILAAEAVSAQDKYSLNLRAESPSRTSKDTKTGRWSLPPGPMKCSK
jgi:hypothetical protein